MIKIISIAAVAALMMGCGSDSDGDSAPEQVTGKFIDSAVSGLTYSCSSAPSTTNTTNIEGEFTCNSGDIVTFSINGFEIGNAAVSPIITPKTLYPSDDEKSIDIAQLLQTLDSDGNVTNGITLNPDDFAYKEMAKVTAQVGVVDFDSLVASFIGKTFVSATNALLHLNDSIAKLNSNNNSETTDEITTSYDGKWVYIYKGVSSLTAQGLQSVAESYAGFEVQTISSSTTCSDFGFTGTPTTSEVAGITTTYYIDYSSVKGCYIIDYSDSPYTSGSSTVAWTYNYSN